MPLPLSLSAHTHFSQARHESTDCGMKQLLAEIIPEKQKEVKELRANHGDFPVGEVTVDMVSGCGCHGCNQWVHGGQRSVYW